MSGSERELDLRAPPLTPGSPALLLEWHVEEGESLRSGQPLAQLIDGSGCRTIHAPCDGRLLEQWVDEGSSVAEGQRLARLLVADGPKRERSERDPSSP